MKFLAILPVLTLLWGLQVNASCFIQGTYHLEVHDLINHPGFPLQITGFVNSGISTTYINWQAEFKNIVGQTAYYNVSGSYKGEYLHLELSISGSTYQISGEIHGHHVSWSAISNWIIGEQSCIP